MEPAIQHTLRQLSFTAFFAPTPYGVRNLFLRIGVVKFKEQAAAANTAAPTTRIYCIVAIFTPPSFLVASLVFLPIRIMPLIFSQSSVPPLPRNARSVPVLLSTYGIHYDLNVAGRAQKGNDAAWPGSASLG